MQADEIVRRLEVAGFHVEPNDFTVWAEGSPEQWEAILPTDEEQQALLALRARCWVEWIEATQEFGVCAPNAAVRNRLLAATWETKPNTTPIAALAAAAKALGLGEGEKRG